MTIQKMLTGAAAIALVAATTGSVSARGISSAPTPVSFSTAVSLPGMVLPAGDYVFETANPATSADVVLVRSRNGRVQWLGLTQRVERRDGSRAAVQLSEARAGEAPRVLRWFPTGSTAGAEFIY